MLGLYGLKPAFLRVLEPLERRLLARRVSPDAVTVAGVVTAGIGAAAVLGGGVVHPSVWILVPLAGLVRLACNALDGSLARAADSARPGGIAVNEIGDRVADLLQLGALAAVTSPLVVLGALVSTLSVSHLGLLGLACSTRRLTDGPMGKTERTVVISCAASVAAGTASTAPFGIAAAVIIAGSFITLLVRGARLRRVCRDLVS